MAPKEPVLVFEMPFLGFYFLNAAALLGAGPLPGLILASPIYLLLLTGRRVADSRTSSFTWQVGVLGHAVAMQIRGRSCPWLASLVLLWHVSGPSRMCWWRRDCGRNAAGRRGSTLWRTGLEAAPALYWWLCSWVFNAGVHVGEGVCPS